MFLSKLNNKKSKHLTEKNIEQYIKDEYGSNALLTKNVHVKNFLPLLQKDYGGLNDCTLTCMTAIIHHITNRNNNVADIYNNVEKIAKKYFYVDNLGTPYLTIRTIFNKVLSKYCSKTINTKCGNNDLITIKNQIDKGNPMILSLFDDGLNYYKKHSVTVFGYKTYSIEGKEKTVLKIYDNWTRDISYLDYDKISSLSVLHYFT